MSDGIARFKDFTGSDEPIQFKVGSNIYTARDDINLKYLGKLSKLGEELGSGGDDMVSKMLGVFERFLVPESFAAFKANIEDEAVSFGVVGINRVRQIIPWLLEQYGLRPTEASPGSLDTSSESGANSTDGVLQEALTS